MRHSRKIRFWAVDIMTAARLGAALLFCIISTTAAAQNWTATLISENDAYFNIGDRHYTNGLYLSLTTPPRPRNEGSNRYSFFLGQSIFTPEDLLLDPPDANDRPYAGWLYAGVRMYRERAAVLDRVDVSLGVVGPSSGAEAVQIWFHALNMFGGSAKPRGWANQLHDEPAAVLSAQRTWRVTLTEGFLDGEFLPEANLALGNVFTYAGIGASLRVGRNLRADWGAPRIQPALQGSDFVDRDAAGSFAWYLFTGIEGRAIARNIFLDGNTWKDSPSVSREAFVADYNLGAALIAGPFAMRLSYTERTREFETQRGNDKFGSLSFSLLLGV